MQQEEQRQLLNCLNELGYESEMFSVDICRKCYLDSTKQSGYIAKEMIDNKRFPMVQHHFLLGNTVAYYGDMIGKDIDLVILDTMHSLPGELLDFISVLYSFSKNAVAVFHDIGQSQHGFGHVNGAPLEYASLVTMSAVAGEKILLWDKNRIAEFPNIGAIRINSDTYKYIDNLFFSLFINWDYVPIKRHMQEYKDKISVDYGVKYSILLEKAIELNIFSFYRRNMLSFCWSGIKGDLLKKVRKSKNIFIYGAGDNGKKISEWIESEGYQISGYLISDGQDKKEKEKQIYYLSELRNRLHLDLKECLIILGLSEEYHLEILDNLYREGVESIVFPHNGVGFCDMLRGMEYESELKKVNDNYINHLGYASWIEKTINK